MNKHLIYIVVFLNLILGLTNSTYACHCEVDGNSKTYQVFEKHWWGIKRAWTCDYHCYSDFKSSVEIVKGTDKQNSFGSDIGNEGVCEGLIYETRLNPYTLWEDYTLVGQETIYPGRSVSSPELKKWFSANCK